eukprot:gene287-biopygen201
MQALGSRAAECGLEEHQQGAQVLPYTDNFLVSLSSKVEALRERELASRAAGSEPVEWAQDLAQSQTKLHTDSSLFVRGGVLNLKHTVRGFWPDEFRYLHITRLELEAIYKTVQSYLRELISKVVQLFCKNQVVVAMLPYFTLRNPELIRRMRRLWILLDLNDIELQARYIKSEANKWVNRLSQDWDALAEKVAILPRCGELFTPTRLGGSELLGGPKLDDVMFHMSTSQLINDAWCIGTGGETTVDGKTPESYDDGDTEFVDMSKEKYEVVSAAATVPSGWDAALQER